MLGTMQPTSNPAHEEFRAQRNQAIRHKFWSLLTGKSYGLLALDQETQLHSVRNASHRGIQTVVIDKIRGSEGRSHDFDADFRPLKETSKDRWVNIAVARQREQSLPAVDLVQVDDIYFVRDGHHRISVARTLGQREIDANVIVWSKQDTANCL